MQKIIQTLAQELQANEKQIVAAIGLLDEGATVPFIARYRKEATDGLDDIQLRNLEERLGYLREMAERKLAILKSIEEQDKLTPELRAKIEATVSKARLEDLYLPYKTKRRTKAEIAKEAGLEPLADKLITDPTTNPELEAAGYVDADKNVADVKAALDGARNILVERFAEDAELIGRIRDYVWGNAKLTAQVVTGKENAGAKFKDYFDYAEPVAKVPSHRALAVFRGRKEEILSASLVVGDPTDRTTPHPCEVMVARRFGIVDEGRAADTWLRETARWAWRVKIALYIELDLMRRLFEEAETEAIHVFAENLRDLLLAAPAGPKPTLALDPGFRSGVKVAVTDATGKYLDQAVIYPHEPQKQWDQSIAVIAVLCAKHKVELISIGNGTASRETDAMAAELIAKHPDLKLTKIMVSEAGASVYSASAFASRELPELDVSIRGAVSIARRLQDPLAELVKIEPKAIGVGQYQHDLSPIKLGKSLNAVVEDCVNAVGVDLNMASVPLLSQVSGVGPSLAESIVNYRDENGSFANRAALKKVPRLGAKAFEQCAGFLRVMNGDNPLDRSAVHPEAYPLVKKILAVTKSDLVNLMGDSATLHALDVSDFTNDNFGQATVKDIIAELEKPGRDPRPEFKTATFKTGVEKISDLKPGMQLEGVVTNVANFGAFVDVGVHQDGLVHVSALADKFVKDPRDIVKPGQVVSVKVMEVDVQRKRIGLSMRKGEEAPRPAAKSNKQPAPKPKSNASQKASKPKPDTLSDGVFASAFAKAKEGKK